MSSAGYHAADDGSLARSTGGAAARGALLIALALAIGLLLIAFALDDPQTEVVASNNSDAAADTDGDGAGDGAAADDGTGDDADPAPEVGEPAEPTETIPPIPEEGVITDPDPEIEGGNVVEGNLFPNNEVNILVANGTGAPGVAGDVRDVVVADGYTAEVSNAPATATAVIFYREGFSANARAIAETLGAAPDLVQLAPDGQIGVAADAISDGRLDAANIVIILGADNGIPPA